MKNYNIEENINFYDELNKSILGNDILCTDQNLCLISNLPLLENYITLDCNHKFNYLPLYKDVLTHKKKFNMLELNSSTLKYNQIRCPYCRNIQNKLLPFLNLDGVEEIHGVNYIDIKYDKYHKCFLGKCFYKSVHLDNDQLLLECNNKYVTKLKEDGNDYCCQHKKIVYKNILKENAKKAKQLYLLEKKNISQDKNNPLLWCNTILKYGINKGSCCGKKAANDNKCKRHLKIKLNNIIL
jgi:hypothetical protein